MKQILILLTFTVMVLSSWHSLADDELPILSDKVTVIDSSLLRTGVGAVTFRGGTKLADFPALTFANTKIGQALDLRINVDILEKLAPAFPAEIHLVVYIDHAEPYVLYTDETGTFQLQPWDGDARSLNHPFMVIEEYSPKLEVPIFSGAFDTTGLLFIEPFIKLAHGQLSARAEKYVILRINSNQPAQLEGEFIAKSSFLPNPDGFGFPNMLTARDSDYPAEDIIALLGREKACYTAPDGSCILKAWVEQLRNSYISEVKDGNCYGMSVSSMMINRGIPFKGKTLVSDYQAGVSHTIDLQSEAVHDMILFFQQSQSALNVKPYMFGDKVQKPSEVLQVIIDSLGTDNPVASLNVIDSSGGHSVLPYAVQAGENGEFKVYVYDNNYPDSTNKFVTINPEQETWQYVAQLNPTTPPQQYSGDLSNLGSISAIPLSEILNLSPVNIAEDVAEFKFSGIGLQMLIANDDDQRIGYDFDTNLHINEIEGAEIIPTFSVGAPPSYKVPVILPEEEIETPEQKMEAKFRAMFEVTLGAVNTASTISSSSFFMQFHDSIVEIGNISLNNGEMLDIAVSPLADMVAIASDKIANQSLIVKLTVDSETDKAGMIYEISDLKLTANTGIMLFADGNTAELGAISFPIKEGEVEDTDFTILDASSYSLRVYKNSAAGKATARRANIKLPVGSINKMRVDKWVDYRPNLRTSHEDKGAITVERTAFILHVD